MPLKFNSLRIDYKAVFKGQNSRLLVGQVKSISEHDDSRLVSCVKLSLDPKLFKYWNVRKHFRAMDKGCNSGVGDIVLISQLVKPYGPTIAHQIKEVTFKNGAVIDPISGRLCHGTDYAEDAINPNLERYRESQEKIEAESEV